MLRRSNVRGLALESTSSYKFMVDHMDADSNRRATILVLLIALTPVLSGCELVEGLLRLGFWTGVIVVLLVVAVIWFVARLFTR